MKCYERQFRPRFFSYLNLQIYFYVCNFISIEESLCIRIFQVLAKITFVNMYLLKNVYKSEEIKEVYRKDTFERWM